MTQQTQPPTLWPSKTISSIEDGERLDRALSDLMKEGRRIYDFTERLHHAIDDVIRKNKVRRFQLATSTHRSDACSPTADSPERFR
jgi:hypothetical protein